jgi:Alanine-zipper, major outer membrane lipoprotein
MTVDSTMKHVQVNRRSRYARAVMAMASVVLISACAEQGEKTASTDSTALATADQAKAEAESALANARQALQVAQQAQAAAAAANERADKMYQHNLKK